MSDKSRLFGDFLEKLRVKLDHYGQVPLVEEKGSITVPPAGDLGFDVAAASGQDGIAVAYERWHWHEDFESVDEAINCFMSGVFGEARLAVTKRGGFAHSWTAEVLHDSAWVPVSTTAYFFFPFWLKRQVIYLRNNRTPRNRDS